MSEHRDEPCPVEPVPTPAHPVGRLPSAGVGGGTPAPAGSGDPAYNLAGPGQPVGPVPTPGAPFAPGSPNAGSGDPAYKTVPDEPPPRRLRRLHRVWPDRDGNISYLLTLCVDGRARVLDNAETYQRLTAFLLDSPARYHWFPRRFVVMPDHLHLIAHQGLAPVRLGQWIKALKAVVGGLERRPGSAAGSGSGNPAAVVGRLPSAGADARFPADAGSGDPAYRARPAEIVGRLPSAGGPAHEFTRLKRSWLWQEGFHDHKFRTPESERRKWEYVCLNPVRYGLVERPEQWPYGGEIFYAEAGGPHLIEGTPPLLETGLLVHEDGSVADGANPPAEDNQNSPAEGSRPTR